MSTLETVFLVHHVARQTESDEDSKLIGVYRTEARARAAVARCLTQPGFGDYPEGFHVEPYELDKDHWPEGFITVIL